MSRLSSLLVAGTVAITLGASAPVRAQSIVFDPNNYVQNVLTAARTLQQINNQNHLVAEPGADADQSGKESCKSAVFVAAATAIIDPTHPAIAGPGSAHRLRRSADRSRVLDQLCAGQRRPVEPSLDRQRSIAVAELSFAALQDTLRVQAGVVGNLDTNRIQTSALVTSSQGASGALQATQAGNQILALQAQQLADLTATIAAQGRAQSLEAAQRASAQDQGREQLRRFLTPGQGYQSSNVQMFH